MGDSTLGVKKLPFPPLLRILSSSAYWGLFAVHVSNGWGWHTLYTGTSTYLSKVQHFSLAEVRLD